MSKYVVWERNDGCINVTCYVPSEYTTASGEKVSFVVHNEFTEWSGDVIEYITHLRAASKREVTI